MKIPTILLITCLLALLSSTYAFNEQTTNNIPLFNLTAGININPTLFRTKHGSVYYNSVANSTNISPSYILIDFNPTNITQILQEISTACDISSFYVFSKLSYHEESSSLVYYCAKNNTLLILEEDGFTVQSTIPTTFQDQFNETKIASDGDSLIVIGINGLYTSQANASEMIAINMISKTVTSHLYFKQAVVGFATNGLFKYIIANDFSQNYTVKVSLYHLYYKAIS